ncbi:MAG: VOC family protein [Chloroflexota bacterium]
MPKYWFDHIHLMSPDPVKTGEFYEQMFGAKKVIRDLGKGRIIVEVDFNGTLILVSKAGDTTQPGLVHFGIATDNVEKSAAELKAKGVRFTQEVREVRPGFKMSFLLAPENVTVELQEGNL